MAITTGQRLGAEGLEAEADAYLQRRLKLIGAVGSGLGLLFFVAGRFATAAEHGLGEFVVLRTRDWFILVAVALIGGLWAALRSRPFPRRALRWFDAAFLYIGAGVCLAIYAAIYSGGGWHAKAALGIVLIVRAIAVPSSALRTCLLSLPPVVALVLFQYSKGEMYAARGVRLTPESYSAMLVWDAAILLACAALATVASHVNFALRRQVAEAINLGQYKVESRIGAGAMGEVFRATHERLKRATWTIVIPPRYQFPSATNCRING